MQLKHGIDELPALLQVDRERVLDVELDSVLLGLLVDGEHVFEDELLDLQVDLLTLNGVHVRHAHDLVAQPQVSLLL